MKKIFLTVGVPTVIAIAVGYGSYLIGKNQSIQEQQTQISSLQKQVNDLKYINDSVTSRNAELIADGKKLVDDYNSLYNEASKYINASRYQPIHCSSNVIGSFTYTDCY